jgi:hypothetical protein
MVVARQVCHIAIFVPTHHMAPLLISRLRVSYSCSVNFLETREPGHVFQWALKAIPCARIAVAGSDARKIRKSG